MRAFPKSIDIWSIILLGYVRLNKAVTEWTRMKENEKFDVFYAKRLNCYYYYFIYFFCVCVVCLDGCLLSPDMLVSKFP
jgi:hypothetical protein